MGSSKKEYYARKGKKVKLAIKRLQIQMRAPYSGWNISNNIEKNGRYPNKTSKRKIEYR
jgi:hypothetical protein